MLTEFSNHQNSGAAFEVVVADLFTALGYNEVVQNHTYIGSLGHEFEIDILFGTKDDATIVEVKKYRPSSPPHLDLIKNAFRSADSLKQETRAEHCLLVVSCDLTPAMLSIASNYPNVTAWDLSKLLHEANRFPDIYNRILSILEIDSFPKADNLKKTEKEQSLSSVTFGLELSEKLKSIPHGRDAAYKFEDVCIEALKYLFENDLFGWHEQSETIDGLQRRDLICRIRSSAEVWTFISNNLVSRYVIFEFKNYSEPITQQEIITTEKYLYPAALRRLAIIISPYGCSKSAKLVIQGAMREHGKLIISLTTDEISRLLIEKDNGGDPNSYLFDVVDNFLMRLGR